MRMYEKIRQIIESTPGLTQKGLAKRMGLNPAAINRMLYGRRNIMVDEVPVIENYLGVSLAEEIYTPSFHHELRTAPSGAGNAPFEGMTTSVPVFGSGRGAVVERLNLNEKTIIDRAPRHPAQADLRDAFAVYTITSEMEPRYMPGELVYVHPGRVPERGRDCLVVLTNGDAFIRRYLGQNDTSVRVLTLSPEKETGFDKDNIKAVYAIVGRG